ncbi:MAG: hypothetical protein EHM90_00330 [Chloroflexi bacterium]|nr:MAG: hypothetical protein EHM90_00330 [Chloroflexota bacterium]
MGAVLVLYHSRQAPVRRAIADHLFAFRRYAGRPCIYINMAVRSLPSWIGRLDIDLVVLHTILLSDRWNPHEFRDVVRRLGPLRAIRAPVVAMPQDEFIYTDVLVEVLDDLGVEHVFTCAPAEEWDTIYGPLRAKGVGFTQVLPGYLEPDTVRRIERLAREVPSRDIDIGYRAWRPKPWLGRHGMSKGWIAEAVEEGARGRSLRTDISLESGDTLLGDAWWRFLLRSRYTIGVESGAGILDRDGSIRACADAHVAAHPGASFEEVERTCFPDRDGELNLRTISPRHLEAAATRTPQILVEGAYSGILEAGRHYLPLKPDFSNLAELLEVVASGEDHRDMADQAHADLVASGRHEYAAFVRTVLSAVPLGRAAVGRRRGILVRGLTVWELASDAPSWGWVRIRQRVRPLAREALRRTGLLPAVLQARDSRRERRLRQG